MLVHELFTAEKITKDLLAERAEDGTYYETAANFIIQYWNVEMDDLSPRQVAWLDKILEDMVEWRIEGRGGK